MAKSKKIVKEESDQEIEIIESKTDSDNNSSSDSESDHKSKGKLKTKGKAKDIHESDDEKTKKSKTKSKTKDASDSDNEKTKKSKTKSKTKDVSESDDEKTKKSKTKDSDDKVKKTKSRAKTEEMSDSEDDKVKESKEKKKQSVDEIKKRRDDSSKEIKDLKKERDDIDKKLKSLENQNQKDTDLYVKMVNKKERKSTGEKRDVKTGIAEKRPIPSEIINFVGEKTFREIGEKKGYSIESKIEKTLLQRPQVIAIVWEALKNRNEVADAKITKPKKDTKKFIQIEEDECIDYKLLSKKLKVYFTTCKTDLTSA